MRMDRHLETIAIVTIKEMKLKKEVCGGDPLPVNRALIACVGPEETRRFCVPQVRPLSKLGSLTLFGYDVRRRSVTDSSTSNVTLQSSGMK